MFKIMKNDHFLVFFGGLDHFPKVFWQVKEWLKFNLHEMTIFLNVVGRSIDSNLLCDKTQQVRVLKLIKNDHFSVFSPSFWPS